MTSIYSITAAAVSACLIIRYVPIRLPLMYKKRRYMQASTVALMFPKPAGAGGSGRGDRPLAVGLPQQVGD